MRIYYYLSKGVMKMSNCYKDNISLQEAMSLDTTYSILTWAVDGLQVECKALPKNATVHMTFVMKWPDGNGDVGVMYSVEGTHGLNMLTVKEFDFLTLEELETSFPSLFKLSGYLFALG